MTKSVIFILTKFVQTDAPVGHFGKVTFKVPSVNGFVKLTAMDLKGLSRFLPGWKNALLALASAVLLILAFPDFEFWFLAWFALVPLMWAVEREKESTARSFILGWIFGTAFFFGTCWWLTFAPITYAGFPPVLAYLLFFFVAAAAGLFPGIFTAVLSVLLRRFGSVAIFAAPFVWVFTEFLRYWITGNNWNALGYSQALQPGTIYAAGFGGVLLISFLLSAGNVFFFGVVSRAWIKRPFYGIAIVAVIAGTMFGGRLFYPNRDRCSKYCPYVIAIQPNVPMSGLTYEKWEELRRRHVRLAESAITKLRSEREDDPQPITVIFPESPMNFMYETDAETKAFINGFAAKNNVSVLFNSAEPDASNGKFFNSAVMVGPQGGEVAQYDKIYLLPFGEAVPFPLEGILPGFVGNFSYGREYDLLPLGRADLAYGQGDEVKGGVMICFESHFGQLSREYVLGGADVLLEMTNDGYLGPTPVLRQHLANAVFRAVETNRPVLRVTNVGITAYINERGEVLDPATPYTEDMRVWSVAKSDGSQTFYVKYGDWFAWLCSVITTAMLAFALFRKKPNIIEV